VADPSERAELDRHEPSDAREERNWLAWSVAIGAWSIGIPVLGAALFSSANLFVAIGAILLGAFLGKVVALPIVLGKAAWWAIRVVYAWARDREGPAVEDAMRITRGNAALVVLVASPLVLLAGALAGVVAGLPSAVSMTQVAAFAGFAWLGLVGPALAASLGLVPAEAVFGVLLFALTLDDDDNGATDDTPTRPPEALRPAPPADRPPPASPGQS